MKAIYLLNIMIRWRKFYFILTILELLIIKKAKRNLNTYLLYIFIYYIIAK